MEAVMNDFCYTCLDSVDKKYRITGKTKCNKVISVMVMIKANTFKELYKSGIIAVQNELIKRGIRW